MNQEEAMVDTVFGKTRNQQVAQAVARSIASKHWDGTLYLGYPVLSSADESIPVDALLVTLQHGIVVLIIAEQPKLPKSKNEWLEIKEDQDRIYFALKTNLGRHQSLRSGRELGVQINVLTIFPDLTPLPPRLDAEIATPSNVSQKIEALPSMKAEFFKPLNAALQRVTSIKPVKKRALATTKNSRGSLLKTIELEIANLDQWQKRGAIESPEGPQRIRGLAGSGKTVVLALKASYLHARNPDWNIAVTFHSRSLYQQFIDLIRRFTFEQTGNEPDWTKLRVLHSWGGVGRAGLYTDMAQNCGAVPRDFLYAKSAFGIDNAFQGVCAELFAAAQATNAPPVYDAVLIDEAQDLPTSFLRSVYHFTKNPKRIIWAYDELQNLSEAAIPSLGEMFGETEAGEPLITLSRVEGQADQDIILPVCYRNTQWALAVAHAVGFGIYREGGLVQHFDEPSLWSEIGYEIISGSLDFGKKVSLERSPNSYPEYFAKLLQAEDAVTTNMFKGELEQAEWVANEIQENLEKEELEHDDVLIVLPNAMTAKKRVVAIRSALERRGIDSHLAGVTSSADQMFDTRSIAISNIYRAKGNEAPMVYVLDCQYCMGKYEQIKLRNTLFTAITRSRAWVRLCGYGEDMAVLKREVDAVRSNSYRLKFKIPTEVDLAKMRKIHRDRTVGEKERIKRAERGLKEFLEVFADGDLDIDSVPAALKGKLRGLILDLRNEDRDTQED